MSIEEQQHPGFTDPRYRSRREAIAQRRLEGAIARIGYTEEEDDTWRAVLNRLGPLHARFASEVHLEGATALALANGRVPEVADLDAVLRRRASFGLTPCPGLLDARSFFAELARRKMPCTQYLRHPSHPEYTPEPDMVHEIVGHLGVLADPRVADVAQTFGRAAEGASPEALAALERLYWFSFEFGVVRERGEKKAFGAGLLSSIAEVQHAFSERVRVVPFDVETVVNTPFQTMDLQPILFASPSVDELLGTVREAATRISEGSLLRPAA
jgi:phenylalanine-4-hydroxylase